MAVLSFAGKEIKVKVALEVARLGIRHLVQLDIVVPDIGILNLKGDGSGACIRSARRASRLHLKGGKPMRTRV